MKTTLDEHCADRERELWENIFNRLNRNRTPTAATRESLVRYLKSQIPITHLSSFEQVATAYRIAGLLSADGVSHLSLDDPICKVLELAAQVELPVQHRARTDTWSQLVKLIDQL